MSDLMGQLPADSKWTVGKTREALDPEREKMLEALTDNTKTGQAKNESIKKAIKNSNKVQIAESNANVAVAKDPTKNFEEEKAKALANIEKGKGKAHAAENLEPGKNPLVTSDKKIERTPPSKGTQSSPVEEAKQDPKARWKMKSILQAYYDGDIDKSTRNFMLADTVANFSRNIGKDISNVGAAFTGGTIDKERGTSMWDARNQEMAKSAIESEKANVANSREARNAAQQNLQIQAQRLQNMSLADRRVIADRIKAMAAKMPTDTAETAMLMKAASVLTNPQMSWQELAGIQGAEALSGLLNLVSGS